MGAVAAPAQQTMRLHLFSNNPLKAPHRAWLNVLSALLHHISWQAAVRPRPRKVLPKLGLLPKPSAMVGATGCSPIVLAGNRLGLFHRAVKP